MDFLFLSSSRGTTMQAVLDRIADGSLHARCTGLIADTEERGCVEKARMKGIPVMIVPKTKGEEREAYDRRVHDAILTLRPGADMAARESPPGFVIAAVGWMFLLSPWLVAQWKNRILNVHPSLLPRHPGAHAHRDVLAAGDAQSGMTIHLIDDGVDTGPIVLQKTCPVLPGDTEETLKDRVQALEKEWYPKALEMISTGELRLPS